MQASWPSVSILGIGIMVLCRYLIFWVLGSILLCGYLFLVLGVGPIMVLCRYSVLAMGSWTCRVVASPDSDVLLAQCECARSFCGH